MSQASPVVFVVDDDVSIRESLEALLQKAGWCVETFDSALKFLARPPVVVPNCLVLDIALPGLNGLDLQKRMVVERPGMPIIFITGQGDIPMTVQAMKTGAIEFLTKPYKGDVLLQSIRSAVREEQSSTRPRRGDPNIEGSLRRPHLSRTRCDVFGGCGPPEQAGRQSSRY